MPYFFPEGINTIVGENSIRQYQTAIAIFIATVAISKLIKIIALKRVSSLSKKKHIGFDGVLAEAINQVKWPLYFFLGIFISFQSITVPDIASRVVTSILIILTTYYVIIGLHLVIEFTAQRIINKEQKLDNKFDPTAIDLLGKAVNMGLWILAIVLILQNLGYNISALIAGLGIGGIAIAFALQSVLADIFAAISIYIERPFQVGDFIIVGSDMGVVKTIGLKTTRIDTLQGQELIIPNKELTNSRVNNYKRMKRRRIMFRFGLVYQTPTEKLKKIPGIIKDIIDKMELTTFDRAHFFEFGESALNFEVVYYLDSPEYGVYMDNQQEINLALREAFEKEDIFMAYPTQTIFLEGKSV